MHERAAQAFALRCADACAAQSGSPFLANDIDGGIESLSRFVEAQHEPAMSGDQVISVCTPPVQPADEREVSLLGDDRKRDQVVGRA